MLAVTCAAVVLLAYTYAGYPILVALAGRIRPLPIRRDDRWLPRVSALVPAHDAERHVADKRDSLLALDYPEHLLEILVCSDGSTDGTDEILARYAARHPRVRPLRTRSRRGKPHALNLMRRKAGGEVLLMTDVRQPLAPGALRALVSRLADPDVGCVSGNLVVRGATGAGLYWKYENWIRRAEGRFRGMVGVTGPIYALRAADLDDLPHDVILDDMWIPMRMRLEERRRIVFAEEAEAYDRAFADRRELGRKVRTLAGNYQLFARMPKLLVPVLNPSWFEVFSHKLLRLTGPWALLALLVSSVAALSAPADLPGEEAPWAVRALVAGQAVFYLAALAGPRAGRITGAARTFVVLNFAAAWGLWRWLRGSQRVTW